MQSRSLHFSDQGWLRYLSRSEVSEHPPHPCRCHPQSQSYDSSLRYQELIHVKYLCYRDSCFHAGHGPDPCRVHRSQDGGHLDHSGFYYWARCRLQSHQCLTCPWCVFTREISLSEAHLHDGHLACSRHCSSVLSEILYSSLWRGSLLFAGSVQL